MNVGHYGLNSQGFSEEQLKANMFVAYTELHQYANGSNIAEALAKIGLGEPNSTVEFYHKKDFIFRTLLSEIMGHYELAQKKYDNLFSHKILYVLRDFGKVAFMMTVVTTYEGRNAKIAHLQAIAEKVQEAKNSEELHAVLQRINPKAGDLFQSSRKIQEMRETLLNKASADMPEPEVLAEPQRHARFLG